jgi:hypothetical protein
MRRRQYSRRETRCKGCQCPGIPVGLILHGSWILPIKNKSPAIVSTDEHYETAAGRHGDPSLAPQSKAIRLSTGNPLYRSELHAAATDANVEIEFVAQVRGPSPTTWSFGLAGSYNNPMDRDLLERYLLLESLATSCLALARKVPGAWATSIIERECDSVEVEFLLLKRTARVP